MDYNFNDELQIDLNALETEWLQQPMLFMKYAEALSDAEAQLDRSKEAIDLIKAQIDTDIRTNVEAYTGSTKKPTEAQITNIVNQQTAYKDALTAVNSAKSDVKIMTMAVRAFDQRKVALENLVRLHGQSYFANPQEPTDMDTDFEKRAVDSTAKGKVYTKLNPIAAG